MDEVAEKPADPTMKSRSSAFDEAAAARAAREFAIAQLARDIYLAGVAAGNHPGARECAREAKALYAELDRAEG